MAKKEDLTVEECPECATCQTVEEPEIPISAAEFCAEMGKRNIETQALFGKKFSIGTATRIEWQRLFDLLLSQPTSMSWEEWLAKNKGGN